MLFYTFFAVPFPLKKEKKKKKKKKEENNIETRKTSETEIDTIAFTI